MSKAQRIIKVPDVGEGIAEVELVTWHVAPGQTVAEDQALAEVMTDKASVEIPSPVAGRVVSMGGAEGQMLAVGSELIRLELEAAGATAPVSGAPEPAAETPVSAPNVAASTITRSAEPGTRLPSALVAAMRPAERPIASPAVRRRAWELGINLADVTATGPAGRVVQADLDRALAAGVAQTPGGLTPTTVLLPASVDRSPTAATLSAGPPAAARPAAQPLGDDATQSLPVIGLRRRIALRMQESKRRIPHFSYVEECDVTEAESLRATLNARWGETRGRLTLLPLLMRALVLALREHPALNATFDDEAGVITRHGAVHLGVATQTAQGLLVPVVRQAQSLDLWGLAAAVTRLADAARAGKSTRADLSGSTITVSSLGALGGIVSTPVINRPEVAIVGVNRIVERPVVRHGAIVVRQTMNLSSSFDHRVIDGADAARFIQSVRALIEQPALLFVE